VQVISASSVRVVLKTKPWSHLTLTVDKVTRFVLVTLLFGITGQGIPEFKRAHFYISKLTYVGEKWRKYKVLVKNMPKYIFNAFFGVFLIILYIIFRITEWEVNVQFSSHRKTQMILLNFMGIRNPK